METLRNFFHTDKWWGKTIFVILTYVVFWCVFYGSWLVIPYDSTVESNDDFIYIFLKVNLAMVLLKKAHFFERAFFVILWKLIFPFCTHCIFRKKASIDQKLPPKHRPLASRLARLPRGNRQD